MCLRGEGACVVVEEVGVKLSGERYEGKGVELKRLKRGLKRY